MKSQGYFKLLCEIVLTSAFIFPAVHAFSFSLTNDNGVVYDNVMVVSVTPKDLLITYSSHGRSSAASIPLKSLPVEVQQRYGYDSGKENIYKADMARRDAAANQVRQVQQTKAETSSSTHVVRSASLPATAQTSTGPIAALALPKERQYGSEHPLYFRVVFGKEGGASMLGVLDESKGTGAGYDTAYVDENMNNDFADDQPKAFPLKKSRDNSTALDPQFSFRGQLGENGNAGYTLDIFSLGSSLRLPANNNGRSVQGIVCTFDWTLNVNEWNYYLINGRMRLFSTAADALKSEPVRLGGGCKFAISSYVEKGKLMIAAGVKDDNGCNLRTLQCSKKALSPLLILSQNGNVVLRQKMEFG
jgi:hypothetical protein